MKTRSGKRTSSSSSKPGRSKTKKNCVDGPSSSRWTPLTAKVDKKRTNQNVSAPPIIDLSSDSNSLDTHDLHTKRDGDNDIEDSDTTVIIEVVQLQTNPVQNSNSFSNREIPDEYEAFRLDPFVEELIGDIVQIDDNGINYVGSETEIVNENRGDGKSKVSSPQPCSSKSMRESNGSQDHENLASRRIQFGGKNRIASSDEDDPLPSKGRSQRKTKRIVSDSDSENSHENETDNSFVRKTATKKNKSTVNSKMARKSKTDGPRVTRKKVRKAVSSSDSSEDESLTSESDGKRGKNKGGPRPRATRRRSKRANKNSKTEELLEILRQKREKLANKPKRVTPDKSPVPAPSKDDDSDDTSSISSASSGSLSTFVVNDPTPDNLDYEGSTPSSSSVSSGEETDEEPDLEIGGSDGEKDLIKEENVSESDDDNETKSCSSSSDGDSPDDGQNDKRCILCKNLGRVNVEGRADQRNNTSWCKCGECRIFNPYVHDYDLVCCREISGVVDFLKDELEDYGICITKHPRFDRDVLRNEGFARSISKHQEPRRFGGHSAANFWESYSCGKPDYRRHENALQNFQASSQWGKATKSASSYLYWIFDQVERGQMLIPACVQGKIRKKFKIPDDNFYNFCTKFKCPNGRHCRLAA